MQHKHSHSCFFVSSADFVWVIQTLFLSSIMSHFSMSAFRSHLYPKTSLVRYQYLACHSFGIMSTEPPFVSEQDRALLLQEYTPEMIHQYRYQYYLPDTQEGYDATLQWLAILSTHRYFTTAIQMPYSLHGIQGVVIAMSTAESSRVCKENMDLNQQGSYVFDPYWLYYQLWWFAGMTLLNFAGITDSRHEGQPLGMLGELVNDVAMRNGIKNWREIYCRIGSGYFKAPLRRLMQEVLSCKNWIEITTGYSMQHYRGIDLYLRFVSDGMEVPAEESHYWMNIENYPLQRPYHAPEDWWKLRVLKSAGQRELVSEWFLTLTGSLISAREATRINRVMRQIDPEGVGIMATQSNCLMRRMAAEVQQAVSIPRAIGMPGVSNAPMLALTAPRTVSTSDVVPDKDKHSRM